MIKNLPGMLGLFKWSYLRTVRFCIVFHVSNTTIFQHGAGINRVTRGGGGGIGGGGSLYV